MMRKRLLLGSAGLAAATAVGFGAFTVTSGGSSLASNSVPTSKVASSTNTTPNVPASGATRRPHWRMGRRMGRSVYSEVVVKQSDGSYKTIISVVGSLKSISSNSITVVRPDTGATITAAITSTTRFGNTTESALASDISTGTAVTVRLTETANNAVSISVPPPPGTRPKPGAGRFGGPFPPPNGTASSSSSASA